MGQPELYTKSQICTKFDSLSTRVNLTLFINSYKDIYLENEHNLS